MTEFGLEKCYPGEKEYDFLNFQTYNCKNIVVKLKFKNGRNYNDNGMLDGYQRFWRLWLESPHNKLQERVGEYFPYMIDLDIDFEKIEQQPKCHQIFQFYQVVCLQLRKKFKDFLGDDEIYCVVQSRKTFTRKNGFIRRGIHLIFPHIIVNNTQALELRRNILNEPLGDLFDNSIYPASTVFDEAIYCPNRTWKMNGNDYHIMTVFGKNGDLSSEKLKQMLRDDLQSTYDGIFANDKIEENYLHYLPLLTTMDRARYLSFIH